MSVYNYVLIMKSFNLTDYIIYKENLVLLGLYHLEIKILLQILAFL